MQSRFFLWLTLFVGTLQAQVTFDPGAITDASGKTFTCLIRNEGWVSNPEDLTYKIGENGDVRSLTLREIKEFHIDSIVSYVKAKVTLDMSSPNVGYYSKKRDPEWQDAEVLLKVLVDGDKARLYGWRKGNVQRFFYATAAEGPIVALVYKKYVIEEKTGVNNHFREQLRQLQKTVGTDTDLNVDEISYDTRDLTKAFVVLNGISAKKMTKTEKGDFNLRIGAGISLAHVDYHSTFGSAQFEPHTNAYFALEAEYIFGFNRQKWAAFAGVGTTSYKPVPVSVLEENDTRMHYDAVEVPFGARYYMYLSKRSRLSLDFGITAAFLRHGEFEDTYGDLQMESSVNAFVSAGYQWSVLGLYVRYNGQRELVDYNSDTVKYKSVTMVVTYKLF
ncbi:MULTISPECIES: hypothetical protein [unclassified Flavobacterium]|uniref:hypothetical protein n=1 Tax=unclassified Flavobacterium TaxID=196869 RepID=UPI001F12D9D9|nr:MULTISPECIES: hypothetical protein [unclassified Flavobacterium]UMY65478.1 hypothetical protein MKO97_13350 [Flavobacterium sp. HJ-32-4]